MGKAIAFDSLRTKWGWDVRNVDDLVTALLGYPEFATVDRGIVWDAVQDTASVRDFWKDPDEMARYMIANCI